MWGRRGARAQGPGGGIVRGAPPRAGRGPRGAARSSRAAGAPGPARPAPPAGANWKAVTIDGDRHRGHEVGIDVEVRVGARPGGDDVRDHADRLVDQHRAVLRERVAGPQQVDVGGRLVGLLQHGRGDAGEHVLERHEDRLVGGPVAEGVDVALELRPPAGDQRLFLAAEVVVEGPHGDVRGGGDVVAGHRVQPAIEGQAHHGLADGGARFRLLALAESGGLVHVSHDTLSCRLPASLPARAPIGLTRSAVRARPQRFPRRACSSSIASNSALKLPTPKPREPWRSMISKKNVGRSWIGRVKIWRR